MGNWRGWIHLVGAAVVAVACSRAPDIAIGLTASPTASPTAVRAASTPPDPSPATSTPTPDPTRSPTPDAEPSPTPTPSPTPSSTEEPLEIAVTVDRAQYAPGETVDIEVRACNAGTVAITQTLDAPPTYVEIWHEQGDLSAEAGGEPYPQPVEQTWQPGECTEYSFAWDQRTGDMERPFLRPAHPGRHRVLIDWRADGTDGPTEVDAESDWFRLGQVHGELDVTVVADRGSYAEDETITSTVRACNTTADVVAQAFYRGHPDNPPAPDEYMGQILREGEGGWQFTDHLYGRDEWYELSWPSGACTEYHMEWNQEDNGDLLIPGRYRFEIAWLGNDRSDDPPYDLFSSWFEVVADEPSPSPSPS